MATKSERSGDAENPMTAALREAIAAIDGDRADTHGGIVSSMSYAADIASSLIGFNLKPTDIVRVLISVKLARIVHGDPTNRDHMVDLAGYTSILAEMVRED